MKEIYILFETAKLAKEIEFNIPTTYYYTSNLLYLSNSTCSKGASNTKKFNWNHKQFEVCKRYSAPTQALLQKWIRETYAIDIIITSNLIGYGYLIYERYPPKNITNPKIFQTYEEALEQGLYETLKLIQNDEKQIITRGLYVPI